jgi:hypothetical protein
MKLASSVNDSISYYDQKIIEYKSSDVSNEVGPYKFVADLTGMSMNRVVNIVAILIILVFDPLAIALLIGVNQLTMLEEKEDKKKNDDKENKHIESKTQLVENSNESVEETQNSEEESKNEKVIVKHRENEFEEEKETIDEQEKIPKDEKETISEKKTLVGKELSENTEENEEYNEIVVPLETIEPDIVVYHDIFGKGTIIDVYPNNRIKVEFDSGIKELSTDFANLKQIKKIKKDWFDEYTADFEKKSIDNEYTADFEKKSIDNEYTADFEKKSIDNEYTDDFEKKSTDNLYFQEKEIEDGKTVLEFTTKEVEHEEEVPYIKIKKEEPKIEDATSSESPKFEDPMNRFKYKMQQAENIHPKSEQSDIQSLTFDHRIIVNDPNEKPKMRFTQDRKGRID